MITDVVFGSVNHNKNQDNYCITDNIRTKMSLTMSIQARMGSTRLPGKVLLPIANRRVLGWVVERCQTVESIETVAVTTGDRPENDVIREWCRRNEYMCLTGPEENLLERHQQVSRATDSETLVRVTGDCPFIPPEEIGRVLAEHRRIGAPYTTNHTKRMPVGTAVDVINIGLLDKLAALGETHPVKLPRENPDDWNVHYTDDDSWAELKEAHLAVDTPSDYWLLVDAIAAVGSDPRAVAKWLVRNK